MHSKLCSRLCERMSKSLKLLKDLLQRRKSKGQNMELYPCFIYSVSQFRFIWKEKNSNSSSRVNFFFDVLGNKRGTHFSTKDLESMGYHFCDSLLDYCDPDRSKVSKSIWINVRFRLSDGQPVCCPTTGVPFHCLNGSLDLGVCSYPITVYVYIYIIKSLNYIYVCIYMITKLV